MKKILISFAILLCFACQDRKSTDTSANQDTTAIVVVDTVAHAADSVTEIQSSRPIVIDSISGDAELIEEKGELVYVSRNEYSFISNPYEFYLDSTAIEDLLGEGVKTKVEEFEAGEGYSAYQYITITYKDTEISFYDYPGKHVSTITTPLLPLKNGILIGMKKSGFTSAMGYTGDGAAKATVYRLLDDYGEMEFFFRADTLYHVYARYEEGD